MAEVGDLVVRLMRDFPEINFVFGQRFKFRPPKTIIIAREGDGTFRDLLLLHEVGHALSGRFEFKTEVERLKIEVEAWEKARELCVRYGIKADEELIQGELDSYREWLHKKSRCPVCGLTRFQTPDSAWHCPGCDF